MKYATLMIVPVVTFVLTGCSVSEPAAGIVRKPQRQELTVGMTAPDIPFTAATGKQTTFNRVRRSIAIVAFTDTPDQGCCRLDPQLVTLGQRFRSASVTVAQISLSSAKCPHGRGCVETCQLSKTKLVALCDTDRIAWKAFRRPKANTAFLIDDRGRIIDIRPLSDLRPIRSKAEDLNQNIDDLYDGLYSSR